MLKLYFPFLLYGFFVFHIMIYMWDIAASPELYAYITLISSLTLAVGASTIALYKTRLSAIIGVICLLITAPMFLEMARAIGFDLGLFTASLILAFLIFIFGFITAIRVIAKRAEFDLISKRVKVLLSILPILILSCYLSACTQNKLTNTPKKSAPAPSTSTPITETECAQAQELVYEDEAFSTYTDDKIWGAGVVSFQIDMNDRLTIYNEDESLFGEIVQNEDMSYFTLDMPKKTVARRIIPQYDFAAFDFDAENINTEKDYLEIYVNQAKRRVKKKDLKYTYSSWEEYLKGKLIRLKPCNLLKDPAGKIIKLNDPLFKITEVKGELINVISSKARPNRQAIKGWIKWKSKGTLLIDLGEGDR